MGWGASCRIMWDGLESLTEKETVGFLGHSACCVACTCSDEWVCNPPELKCKGPPSSQSPPTPHLPLLGSARSVLAPFFRDVTPAPRPITLQLFTGLCVCVSPFILSIFLQGVLMQPQNSSQPSNPSGPYQLVGVGN